MNVLKICITLLSCNVYAGQILDPIAAQSARQKINPTAISLYQLCIRELAEPGIDNRGLPDAIKKDIYSFQVEQFAEYSCTYEELRERALQREAADKYGLNNDGTVGVAAAYAYRYFLNADVPCTTKLAHFCVRSDCIPMLEAGCMLATIFSGAYICVSGTCIFPVMLKLAKITLPCALSSCCLQISQMYLKKQFLDVALPHYNPPRTIRMDLDIPASPLVHRESFPVDEDTSGEDAMYDEDDALL